MKYTLIADNEIKELIESSSLAGRVFQSMEQELFKIIQDITEKEKKLNSNGLPLFSLQAIEHEEEEDLLDEYREHIPDAHYKAPSASLRLYVNKPAGYVHGRMSHDLPFALENIQFHLKGKIDSNGELKVIATGRYKDFDEIVPLVKKIFADMYMFDLSDVEPVV